MKFRTLELSDDSGEQPENEGAMDINESQLTLISEGIAIPTAKALSSNLEKELVHHFKASSRHPFCRHCRLALKQSKPNSAT